MVKVRSPLFNNWVVSPRAVMRKATFQKWFILGLEARATLPTICVHRCKVAYVSCQLASGKGGQAFELSMYKDGTRASGFFYFARSAKCKIPLTKLNPVRLIFLCL